MGEPWYLKGWTPDPLNEGWCEGSTASGRPFRVPVLSAREAHRVADGVREAALRARVERRLEEVVAAVSRAACRLADPSDRNGAVKLLGEELGWAGATARATVVMMGRGWREEALWSLIRSEFPDPGVLESFRPAPEAPPARPCEKRSRLRRRRAAGPPLLFMVQAGNVPGVAVTALIRGLLVRSGVLSRVSREEPALTALFCRKLCEEDPLLGACVASTWWPAGADAATWDVWSGRSGRVVTYGGAEAIAAVRRRLPAHVPLVAYGPRVGLGVLLPDVAGTVEEELAAGIALDVCAYEQQGCVSPRLIYLLGASMHEAERFGERLGSALTAELERTPPSAPDVGQAVAIRAVRAEGEFRGYGSGSGSKVITSADDLSWTLVVQAEPELAIDALPRVVRISPVPDLVRLEELLRPLAGRIQAVGYAGSRGVNDLAELATRLGVSRLAPFGTVAWPPSDWRHDGRPQLLPLVDWTDWEMEAS